MLKDAEGDPEMTDYAEAEGKTLKEEMDGIEEKLTILLLPKDPMDEKDIMLEIRAGAIWMCAQCPKTCPSPPSPPARVPQDFNTSWIINFLLVNAGICGPAEASGQIQHPSPPIRIDT